MLCLPRNPWAGVRYLRRNEILSEDRKEQEEQKGITLTKKVTKEQKEKSVQKR